MTSFRIQVTINSHASTSDFLHGTVPTTLEQQIRMDGMDGIDGMDGMDCMDGMDGMDGMDETACLALSCGLECSNHAGAKCADIHNLDPWSAADVVTISRTKLPGRHIAR